ncbi:MAG: hypothetical protein EBU81_07365, partial [Proteobacteria bacterium]|nr:hypothetical protein [Pseudomonadota bacterium]
MGPEILAVPACRGNPGGGRGREPRGASDLHHRLRIGPPTLSGIPGDAFHRMADPGRGHRSGTGVGVCA